jgi:hypothetical protein
MGKFEIILLSQIAREYTRRKYVGIGQSTNPPSNQSPKYEISGKVTDAANMTGEGYDAAPKSWLGVPVFADVRFKGLNNDPDIVLQSVIVSVTQTRNIVATPVQGRDGTVKEYVSDGDYAVTLSGAIVTEGADNYPQYEVNQLVELLRRKEALEVVSDFLRIFGVYNIVVMSYEMPQTEGVQNAQYFQIECLSDVPVELIEEL